MRGAFVDQGRLFSYISPEARVPANHPLRKVRELLREVLRELNRSLSKLYASEGRPSIPPEQLLSALLLQVFYGIRSERQLMEQLDYNLLYRWFVGYRRTTRCGTRPPSRRTATGCRTARYLPSS
jgi:transposase